MKITVAIIAVLMCFEGSSSLFYGANVQLPQAKALSESIEKCVAASDAITTKLCNISKKSLKFNQEKFKNVANSVTEMQYIFQSMKEFHNQFLKCLNDQSQKQTTEVTIRNIDILIYQLQNIVVTGIANKFVPATDNIGVVFGSGTRNNVATVTRQFVFEFVSIFQSLSILKTMFREVADAGLEISSSTINSTLTSDSFTNLVSAFKDIEVTSKQTSAVFDGALQVVTSLESISVAVEATETNGTASQKQAQFSLDQSNQAAKKTYVESTLAYVKDIEVSFENFTTIVSNLYVADEIVQEVKKRVDIYSTGMRTILNAYSSIFITAMSANMEIVTTQSAKLSKIVTNLVKAVKVILEDTIATAGASVPECFKNNTAVVSQLVSDLEFSASQCLVSQKTVPQQAQSLLLFFIEGIAIEAKGVADRLCSCSVVGDATTNRRAKNCLANTANSLFDLGKDQQVYLQAQVLTLSKALAKAQGTLSKCITDVETNYTEKIAKFQKSLSACLIG